jgi:hypothetical protein
MQVLPLFHLLPDQDLTTGNNHVVTFRFTHAGTSRTVRYTLKYHIYESNAFAYKKDNQAVPTSPGLSPAAWLSIAVASVAVIALMIRRRR